MSKLRDILVVESDDLIRVLLTETLSDEGYVVRSVSDRTGMHRALNIQPPDLLLCDVDLDRGPGPSLIDDVQVLHSAAVPMVLMTTNVWTARSLARQGLNFCLLKPFDLDELFTCVAWHIGSAGGYAGVPLLEQAAGV